MVKGIGLALDAANGRYRGFTPTELAECLGRMAVNDSNKMKVWFFKNVLKVVYTAQ